MKIFSRHVQISAENRRRLVIGGSVLVALFVLLNIGVGLAYRDRTYPGTTAMGKQIGNVAFESLPSAVAEAVSLPDSVRLVHGEQSVALTSAQLGLTLDAESIEQSARRQRSWLPLWDLVRNVSLELPLRVSHLKELSPELAKQFHRDPVDAHLTLSGTEVGTTPESSGYALDETLLERSLLEQVAKGKSTVDVPVHTVKPRVSAADLSDDKKDLEARLATPVSYQYAGNTRVVKPAEVAAWYGQRGSTFEVDDSKLQAFIEEVGSGFNMRVKDIGSVVAATKSGLDAKRATALTLSKQPAAKTYKYCVGVEGLSESHLAGLKSQLRSTFTDPRGWSMKGLIEFQEVASGCHFTVWLAAAQSVPSFSGDCDTVWSCRVGSNVIANFDRWQNASEAWQGYGGTIEDYRHLTINHETGHWFGFEHRDCPGAGQKAPVMQQQSLNLGGCTFSPWPSPSELQALRNSLGI